MYCGGGFNLQNLPRDIDLPDDINGRLSIRGCFVPAAGNVFVDVDYNQIELVVLAYVLEKQFGFGSTLRDLINGGEDVHRLIAAAVLDKSPDAVTRAERNSAKAVSFGRPGGMGVSGLREYAHNTYGHDLTDTDVEARIEAYHRLCPELSGFLADDRDGAMVIAQATGMSPSEFAEATETSSEGGLADDDAPKSWLGGMLLKVLRSPHPTRNGGRGAAYSPAEVNYFWCKAGSLPVPLHPRLQSDLQSHRPSPELAKAVADWAGRRPMVTVTGRIRAGATFCASRNTCFQGPAADGMILGMWKVWRAGHHIVSAIHDEVVVERPADGELAHAKAEIERLLVEGMQEVVPGMGVKVEGALTASLDKAESFADSAAST